MVPSIDTPAKRARLPVSKNPVWAGISGGRGGASLGYRKGVRGGSWIAKLVVDGQRFEERIGVPDDTGAPADAMSYRAAVAAALEWSRRQHAAAETRIVRGSDRDVTVASAVAAYSAVRVERARQSGKNAEGRLARYVLSDTAFAALRLSRLKATAIEGWRGRLPTRLAPTTVNRLLGDVRAALNAAAEKHRQALPAHITAEIRVGTRAIAASDTARKQILSDEQVRAVVEAAFAVDPSGDFGRMVLLAAATGARHSQLTSLTVRDVQAAACRIMVPASKKGRAARAKPPIAVPVAPDVIERLRPVLQRKPAEVLLQRWSYRRPTADDADQPRGRWIPDGRRPWGAADELSKLWAAAIGKAGLPLDIIPYALRHSSIVRGLRANLPIRLVAALHNTSILMIEQHYAAHITDAAEDLARRAVASFAPAAAEAAG